MNVVPDAKRANVPNRMWYGIMAALVSLEIPSTPYNKKLEKPII
jgi:hypothetical protein